MTRPGEAKEIAHREIKDRRSMRPCESRTFRCLPGGGAERRPARGAGAPSGRAATSDAAGRAEIAPAAPALYASTEVPDADEVTVAVRVRCDAPEHRTGGTGEDRCLGEIRERLGALGVPKR
jgi:hypothetical protein